LNGPKTQKRRDLVEIFVLIALFLLLSVFSLTHVDKSILVVKYLFQYNIQYLPQNYFKYHHAFSEFLFQTCIFHQGNSEAGWKTAFFLWPLFVFCDALGGLTLTNICLFTVITSLLTLILFYWWVRKNWGPQAAFWGAGFFGFSAVFQEFARSGSYDAYSILTAMLWIMLFFYCAQKATALSYGVLGFFTGLSWYGYSMLRTFIVAALIEIFYFAKRRCLSGSLFLAGVFLWIIPGVIILLQVLHRYHFHGTLGVLMVDKENIFSIVKGDVHGFFEVIFHNFVNFFKRLLGFNDLMDCPSNNQAHAHFLNHLLVIPMILGFISVWKRRKEISGRLLIMLSAVIFLTPLFTSSWANNEARRFLFYVLPVYCLIGIGMREIFLWRDSIKREDARSMAGIWIALCVSFVLLSEIQFSNKVILSGQRELGLADFADKLNERQESATIVYLEKKQDSFYYFSNEGYLLRLLLEKNGRHNYEVKETLLDTPLDPSPTFYIVKSPMITNKEFRFWCQNNRLVCGHSVLRSAIKNQSVEPLAGDEAFELYAVSPQGNPSRI